MNYTTTVFNNTTNPVEFKTWLAQQLPQSSNKLNVVLINHQNFCIEELKKFLSKKGAGFSVLLLRSKSTNATHKHNQVTQSNNTYKQLLYLPVKNEMCAISVGNISRLEALSNYTKIYVDNITKPIITSKTLKHYERKLNPNQFMRPNRSHLINTNFISNTPLRANKYLILKDETIIKISRRRLSYVKQQLRNKMEVAQLLRVSAQ